MLCTLAPHGGHLVYIIHELGLLWYFRTKGLEVKFCLTQLGCAWKTHGPIGTRFIERHLAADQRVALVYLQQAAWITFYKFKKRAKLFLQVQIICRINHPATSMTNTTWRKNLEKAPFQLFVGASRSVKWLSAHLLKQNKAFFTFAITRMQHLVPALQFIFDGCLPNCLQCIQLLQFFTFIFVIVKLMFRKVQMKNTRRKL